MARRGSGKGKGTNGDGESDGDDTRRVPLPKFEGKEVKGRDMKIGGSARLDGVGGGALKIGQEIVFIGTAKVASIGHAIDSKRGIVRVEHAAATELFVVDDSTDALDLLQQARQAREDQLDALLGRQKLPLGDAPAGADPPLDGPGDGHPDAAPAKDGETPQADIDDEFERLQNAIREDDDPEPAADVDPTDDDWEDPPREA